MMRIFHVNMCASGGGLEQYLSQIFQELDSRGHRNLLLYGEKSQDDFPFPNVKTFFFEGITHIRCQELDSKLKLAQSILEKENPDIIFLHQVLNLKLIDLLTKQKPSVRFVHDFKLICPDGGKSLKSKETICPFPLGYLCQARAYRYRCSPRNPLLTMPLIHHSKQIRSLHRDRSQMVVASAFMKSVLIYNDFDEANISIIPIFTDIPELTQRSTPSKEMLILAVGRMIHGKGIDYLLRAFALIKHNAMLTIAGNGPELTNLRSRAQELGVSSRVTFTGWLNHDELDNLYHRCAIVIVPSIWPESFGMVGIEAMAYAKPVVAFDVGGISEWLKDGETGFLVNPKDIVGLAEKIETILHDPSLAERMGAKALDTVKKRFLAESHINQLLTLFEKTINSFQKK